MIEKTPAIVLRYAPYSNTSRVVTWLTPAYGRIVTVIKGSQRPKSPFLGQYDLFYTCELLFYARDRNGIHIAKECSPVKTRDGLRRDWEATATASYFCDLVQKISPTDAPHAGSFELLDRALDDLADQGSSPSFLFWFELKFLDLMGVSPRLQNCMECRRPLNPTPSPARFSWTQGGVLCPACAGRKAVDGISIPPDVLAMLASWQRAKTSQAALNTQCTPKQRESAGKLLGLFLGHHLDTGLASRGIALDTLEHNP